MEALSTAVLLGLVEGLTEFLPVSSTGHLILAGEALGFSGPKAATFEIAIQFGAILAVLCLYRERFLGLLRPAPEKNPRAFAGLRGIGLLLLTTLPGAVMGLLAGDFIKNHLFTPASVAPALLAGALLMLLVEWRNACSLRTSRCNSLDELTPVLALGIGCCQCMALWPGFSRSASTIMGGMLLGMRRETAAEYSFLAAVPLITGAVGYDLLKSLSLFNPADLPFFAVGSLFAFLSAMIAIKAFITLLGKITLRPFAIYRIFLVIPVYWFMLH